MVFLLLWIFLTDHIQPWGASSSVVRDISSNNTLGEGAALLKRASTTRTQTLLVVIYFLVYSSSEYHSIA
jgi:hypothetical protein